MKKLSISLALALVGLSITLVAATAINTLGSDPQPFQIVLKPGCSPKPNVEFVLSGDNGGNNKDIAVVLSGDFTRCGGWTALVSIALNPGNTVYAFHCFGDGERQITLTFGNGQGGGDFKQKFPLIVDRKLVENGPSTPPPHDLTLDQVSVEYGYFWQ